MKQPPRRNLPPDAEQWGRFVEDRLAESERNQTQTAQQSTNAIAGLNGTLAQLAGQIARTNELVEALGQQQVMLRDQQNQINATVNAIPVSSFQSSSAEGFGTVNGVREITSVTFPVPAGKTRCSIMANYQGFFGSDASVPNYARAGFNLTVTGGYIGPWATMTPDNMDTFWVIGTGGIQLTSLGSSVTVGVRAMASNPVAPPSDTNYIDLFALAVFS